MNTMERAPDLEAMVRRSLIVGMVLFTGACSGLKPGTDAMNLDAAGEMTTDGDAMQDDATRHPDSRDEGSARDGAPEYGSVFQIRAGFGHTCAILEPGLQCWGSGEYGELGYGNTRDVGDDETPASAGYVNLGAQVYEVALGDHHSCAVLEEGRVRCWGSNAFGQLGYGHTRDVGADNVPADEGDVSVGSAVLDLALGRAHTCARLVTRQVRCWGYGGDGALGYGNTKNIGDDELPSAAGDVDLGGTVAQIAAGGNETCALLDSGAVRCWGDNSMGQLGYGRPKDRLGDDESPASAGDIDVGGIAIEVSTGGMHTCVILADQSLRCWGLGPDGQLGYPHTTSAGIDEPPATSGSVDVGGRAIDVSISRSETCALLEGESVRCWGSGVFGALGYGSTANIGLNEPPRSAGNVYVDGRVHGVSTSGTHTCVRLENGRARCWGDGRRGVLGYGRDVGNIGDDELPASAGDVPTK